MPKFSCCGLPILWPATVAPCGVRGMCVNPVEMFCTVSFPRDGIFCPCCPFRGHASPSPLQPDTASIAPAPLDSLLVAGAWDLGDGGMELAWTIASTGGARGPPSSSWLKLFCPLVSFQGRRARLAGRCLAVPRGRWPWGLALARAEPGRGLVYAMQACVTAARTGRVTPNSIMASLSLPDWETDGCERDGDVESAPCTACGFRGRWS